MGEEEWREGSVHRGDVGDFVDEMDKADRSQYLWRNPDKLWVMTDEGLDCLGCDVDLEDGDEMSFRDFRKLSIEGSLKVVIGKGDDYSVRLSGNNSLVQQVTIEQLGDVLNISTPLVHPPSPLRLYISMPELLQLDAEETDDMRIEGFEGGRLQVSWEGGHDLKMNVQVDTLMASQEGSGKIDLRGQARYLRAILSDNAKLDAEKMAIAEAEVIASDNSNAKLGAIPNLKQQADDNARISVKND